MDQKRPSRSDGKRIARPTQERKSQSRISQTVRGTVLDHLQPETSRQWTLFFLDGWFFDQRLIRDQLSQQSRTAEAADLIQGMHWAERVVIRDRTLEMVLRKTVSRPKDQVQGLLWTLLKQGAAELLFGPPESAHAAISETVELCRWLDREDWSGFANGVLRGVQRLLSDQPAELPSVTSYPWQAGVYRQFQQPFFSDPGTILSNYLGEAFSLPSYLAREWSLRFEQQTLWPILWSTLSPHLLTVRVHRLQTEAADWQNRCQQSGIELLPTSLPEVFRIEQKIRIHELPGYATGEFVIQDWSALQAVKMLNPYPKQKVLDLCAGPGTKTTQLAELMLDQGEILACDITVDKLSQIASNIERLQLTSVKLLQIDKENPVITQGPFDAILIDAPCSNSGVLGKRPEARWRIGAEELQTLSQIQWNLLEAGLALLDPEGQLVYSTCSIEPEENERLIERWLQVHPELVCVDQQTLLPTAEHDGSFCARIEHRESEDSE